MKKLLIVIALTVFGFSSIQSQNIKLAPTKNKYENVYYRESSTKFTKFLVDRIVYSSNFKGKDHKHVYQVSIYGTVNGTKKTLHHNVQSTNELDYYKNVFNSRYKRIQLYYGSYKMGGKTYYNTAINVEY